MESNNNVIHDTWNRYSDFYTRSTIALPEVNLDQFLPSFLSSGNFYYVVDFCDKKIKYVDPGIADVLGLDPTSATVDDILGRIHPEDVNYVAQTESVSVRFMLDQMNKESIKSYYKTSYCFRFKLADGSYELFHNESVYLSKDDSGRIAQVLHIHTNVNHITSVNNYMPSLVDTKGSKKMWPVNVNREPESHALNLQFSKREMEIIKLIALGYKSEEIADSLFISLHTVHSHRKNIIRKSGVKTSSELISLCVREGLI
ncbi:LuxR C-terminal-related transcriptional regulator [Pedobacter gandavensis]|uniref:LuxR C-terminal-related transcriptional regulator n=1 Tax=Pedobacter gandavensis TaxID=2679963 RepID=UPI00292FBE30|nr:LuxR C-terminal-related transcriptional regulator [Pedobacter gandavensis]